MTVKEMRAICKGLPADTQILIASWNGSETVLRYTYRCCNTEHQDKRREIWLSNEGFPRETTGLCKCGDYGMLENGLCYKCIAKKERRK